MRGMKRQDSKKKLDVWGWLTPLRSKNEASEGQAKQAEHECCGGGGCCGGDDEKDGHDCECC